MIDVIIPAYNANNTIADALKSIAMQKMSKDLNVYIIDDCSNENYNDVVDKFKDSLNIIVLKTPKNSGPGFARQYGIDNSKSEFIVFLDADDQFYSYMSISYLYNTIISNNSDMCFSKFIEEIDKNDEKIIHFDSDIWMHGKIYRRSFLENNNIRFSYTRSNEDTGFNKTIYILSNKISYTDEITYVWKFNPNSITRINNFEYNFSGLNGFINSICLSIKNTSKSNNTLEKRAQIIFETIYEMYYNYIYYKNNCNSNLILEWCKDLKKLYIEYFYLVDINIRKNALYKIYNEMINRIDLDVLINNDLGFDNFINLIDD